MGIKLPTSTGEFAGLLNHQTVAMENGPLESSECQDEMDPLNP